MNGLPERLFAAYQSFRKGIETEVLKTVEGGITGPQMFMLYFIKQQEKCRLTQIADKLGVKPSAVTVMIDRLENAGYVVRSNDPKDRRSILVELTGNGKEVLEKAVSKRNEVISTYLSRLQPEERELVTSLLEKMVTTEMED